MKSTDPDLKKELLVNNVPSLKEKNNAKNAILQVLIVFASINCFFKFFWVHNITVHYVHRHFTQI